MNDAARSLESKYHVEKRITFLKVSILNIKKKHASFCHIFNQKVIEYNVRWILISLNVNRVGLQIKYFFCFKLHEN